MKKAKCTNCKNEIIYFGKDVVNVHDIRDSARYSYIRCPMCDKEIPLNQVQL